MTATEFLRVAGIFKRRQAQEVLRRIDFVLEKGQKLVIAGETGSGKTTLLKIIGGLINPDEGQVFFQGVRVKKVPEEKLLPGHPGIAYLAQDFELRHHYRVAEILAYARSVSPEVADRLFEICRISHLLQRTSDQLSGGEKQRIALARTLVSAPKLLLLDEPYSNLDMIHTGILKSVIRDIQQEMDISCIMIGHAPQDSLSWADKIIVMQSGSIVQSGKPEEIYDRPASAYVAGLFGKFNVLSAGDVKKIFGVSLDASASYKIMIRPPHIRIVPGSAGAVVATRFLGVYSETDVSVGDLLITVADLVHRKAGDPVSLQVSARDCLPLPQ